MAILRNFRDASIQENNIVQTVASAAGTLSSIIFVLPTYHDRLLDRFSILDVILDLRARWNSRRDVFDPIAPRVGDEFDLPYPEGVACAEVLKVGSSGDSATAHDVEHGRAGLLAVLWGSIVSAAFALIIETQLFASDVAQNFRVGRKGAVSGYDFSLSFLLLELGTSSVFR